MIMALTKDQKTAQVKELTDRLQKAQSVVFSHYIGMTVADVSELRNSLRDADAEMKVGKKTLLRLALKEAGLPEPEDSVLDGAVACIFSYSDPLSGAQVSHKFAKDHEEVSLIGGIFEQKILTKEETVEFAKMPSKDQLLATFVSMLQSPLYSFASMCNSPLSSFARALAEKAREDAEDAKDAGDAKEVTTDVSTESDSSKPEDSSDSSASSDSPDSSQERSPEPES